MSSGSNEEVDVIRTRIPAYDDDNTVLYAYEPNTAYFSNAIYDAIQDLDKKFDIIHGKVSRIHRFRYRMMKSMWQSYKLHGNRYKNYNYLPSRKSRGQKRKRRDPPPSLSVTESYSPTIPSSRQDDDSQSNTLGTPIESQKSPEREQESFFRDQEAGHNQSPGIATVFAQPYEQYEYVQEEPMEGPSYYGSPQANSTRDFVPLSQATPIPPATILIQMGPDPISSPGVVTYSPLFDNPPSRHNSSPPCTSDTYAPTSPVRNNLDFFKENFPEDPSTWTVEDVVMFLLDVDPQTLEPLADLFREHAIDGKALLLLRSDTMIKYMGIKLGTALKLCHYIDKLKEGRYIYNL
ncbi:sex comb on midleg-like protein 1 isoform X2 [Moschus berezovskii]|uniref:sex comb on midleg-like protein 1 isoform X2 n=1 Tax=Moschus berezovskii TaxID=68408 RepID=UPI002444EDF1|nr:sex comb on midleg-like protein 1 isoform X2 [Moschus berezovskii]